MRMRVVLAKVGCSPSLGSSDNSESLALGYLASSLQESGYDVIVHNAALRSTATSELVKLVCGDEFGLVGFNVADPTLVETTIGVIKQLRQNGVQIHICIGGHTATFEAATLLRMCPEIDSVTLFEGEATICELAAAIDCGDDWRGVPGIAFLENGRVVKSEPRPLVRDLDRLPFPDRVDLPYVLRQMPDVGAVPVLSSRGCYFNCAFCSVRAFYQQDGHPTWRRRTIDNVLDEVEQLIERYGVKDILFVDDLFISRARVTVEYAEKFSEAVLKRGLDFAFTISATIDSVNKETFWLLREAGLRQVYLGAESASPEILKYLKKWFGPEQIETAVSVLEELDLDASVSYINFTPATRIRHLRENVAFFRRLGTNILQGLLNRYQVYRGTPLFDDLERSRMLDGEFPHYDYRGTDQQVELVYAICKSVFGPILSLACELKRVERRTQLPQLVEVLSQSSGEDLSSRANDGVGRVQVRSALSSLRRAISEDSATMFEEVLNFVEQSNGVPTEEDALAYREELGRSVQKSCTEWSNTVRFFDGCCLDEHLPTTEVGQGGKSG